MRNITSDIKNGTYKSCYLLYGEEEYLKRQFKNNLIYGICNDDTMNYSYYEGKDIDVNSIIAMCETLPFFADKRIVIVENSGFFKSSQESLAEYISGILDTTCLVFVEKEVDKRNKVYKKIKENGYVCELNRQPVEFLEKWISGKLSSEGKKITRNTMGLFLDTVGYDMDNICTELEKIISYCLDKEVVEDSDIKLLCTPKITSKVFDMIDAISYKNQEKAMKIYYELIANREAPLMILYMLSRQFNIMLQISELVNNGFNSKQIADKTGIAPFIISKTMRQINNFSITFLKETLSEGVELEEKVKSGNMNDQMAVEMLIIKCC